jgi:hypothetical protein
VKKLSVQFTAPIRAGFIRTVGAFNELVSRSKETPILVIGCFHEDHMLTHVTRVDARVKCGVWQCVHWWGDTDGNNGARLGHERTTGQHGEWIRLDRASDIRDFSAGRRVLNIHFLQQSNQSIPAKSNGQR